MLLTKGLEVLAANMRGDGLDQESWLELALIADVSTIDWNQISNTQDLVCGCSLSLFLFNYTTTAVALTLGKTLKRKVIKSTRFKILLPLAVSTASVFVQLSSEIITNFRNISLLEPLLFLMFRNKCPCHLGLKFFFIRIIGSLDPGFLLFAIFWAASPFRFTASTSAHSLFLLLDLLVHSPPFSKVGEANLVMELGRV